MILTDWDFSQGIEQKELNVMGEKFETYKIDPRDHYLWNRNSRSEKYILQKQ